MPALTLPRSAVLLVKCRVTDTTFLPPPLHPSAIPSIDPSQHTRPTPHAPASQELLKLGAPAAAAELETLAAGVPAGVLGQLMVEASRVASQFGRLSSVPVALELQDIGTGVLKCLIQRDGQSGRTSITPRRSPRSSFPFLRDGGQRPHYSACPQGYVNCEQAAAIVLELDAYLRHIRSQGLRLSVGILTLNRYVRWGPHAMPANARR